MEYKQYTLKQLLKGNFRDEPVEVRGIPRGTTSNDTTTWGYLEGRDGFVPTLKDRFQSKAAFVQFHGRHMHSGMPEPTLSLLRASSESGLEV